jgi:hypothetical protein
MKFYMASYSGSDSDGMNYKKHGRENDLYQLFPEFREEFIHEKRTLINP